MAKILAIDEFVKSVILDCYKRVPEQAAVVVTCVQNYSSSEQRDYALNIEYIANKKKKESFTGGINLERGDELPDYAVSIQRMIAAHGIPSTVSSGRTGGIEARIIELNPKVLLRFDFWIDNAAEILGVAPYAVADAYYRLYKREVSGRCIGGKTLFAIGKRMKMKDEQILGRLEAYYTR